MKKFLLLMAVVLSFVFISCGDDKDEPAASGGHKYVDLGLPSGTLWATCNIGAKNPEDYGDYFAWGETEPKEFYDWSNYKWCNDYDDMTKYCTDSDRGKVDNKTELDLEDDAAYVNWGENWRMPTYEQVKELVEKCSWAWMTKNGVNGSLVTGPNGESLFLPASGYRSSGSFLLDEVGSSGYYWSRTLDSNYSYRSFWVSFDSSYKEITSSDGRFFGHSVRAVHASQN